MSSSAWKPFERRDFRGLWLGTFMTYMANWMQQVGAASLMTTLTPSPLMTALVQSAASLPVVLVVLPAGAMADLVDRRHWLIGVHVLLLAIAAVAALVVASGVIAPWSLLALTALIGTGFALLTPASQAIVGDVIPREEMPAALALSGVSFNISRVLGPVLAGGLIGSAGGTAVYGAVALCSLGVLAFLLRWPGVPRSGKAPAERLWPAVRAGVRYMLDAPACKVQLIRTLTFMSCGSAAWALLPVLARDVHGLGAGGYAVLLGAFGIGGVLGVLVMPRLRRRWPPGLLIAASAVGFGVVTALLGIAPLWVALPLLLAGGAVWILAISSIFAALQAELPDQVRARGLSVFNLVYFLAMALGAAGWGSLASALGTPLALLLAGAAMALSAPWLRRDPPQGLVSIH